MFVEESSMEVFRARLDGWVGTRSVIPAHGRGIAAGTVQVPSSPNHDSMSYGNLFSNCAKY